jgi:tRNA G18 (ribose-2'-O)-methylase SpoU
MLHVRRIDSVDLPQLEPYRTLKRSEEHRQRRIFVAQGEKVVQRLLASHFRVISVILTEDWFVALRPQLDARRDDIQVFIAAKSLFEPLTGHSVYQGVLAVGQIPVPETIHRLLHNSPRPRLFAAVEGISNAENLGVIVRNCAAFGVHGLIVGETSSSPFLRRSVRSSMGAIFQLPTAEVTCLADALLELRHREVRVLAAHPRADTHSLSKANLTRDCCVVFGGEGPGITPRILELCDETIAVPMHGTVDSLNVGSASAVFFYEARRQRGALETVHVQAGRDHPLPICEN